MKADGTESRAERRPFRIRVDAPAHILSGAGPVQAIVHDVSENGLKVELNMAPPAGVVTVKLPGFPSFSGEVRWRGGRYVGIEFLNPIPQDFLSLWVESHGQTSRR